MAESTNGLRPGIGLALGGGVVYSIAGIGVARVLEEARIPIGAVSGTSGGALVGAAIAAGLRGWELSQAAEEMDWNDLVRFAPGRMGLLDGDRMSKFVERVTGCRTFEDLKIPFSAVCTDILRGREVRFTSGPLGRAVQASCAIPGLFQPVKYEDFLLVDGGVTDNLPVAAVRDHRPALTVAVDVLSLSDQYQGRLRTAAHVVLKAYHTMVRRRAESEDQLADFIVMPNVSGLSVMNFANTAALIEKGEEATRPFVPRLRAMLENRLAGAGNLACPL